MYDVHRYPSLFGLGYCAPTFHHENVKNLFAVNRCNLRRLNYSKTVFGRRLAPNPAGSSWRSPGLFCFKPVHSSSAGGLRGGIHSFILYYAIRQQKHKNSKYINLKLVLELRPVHTSEILGDLKLFMNMNNSISRSASAKLSVWPLTTSMQELCILFLSSIVWL